MTGDVRAIKLHVMETADCDLSCSGCYLKGPLEAGMEYREAVKRFFPDESKIEQVNTAFYLNNLKRDPTKSLHEYMLLTNKIVDQYNLSPGRLLVTDSLNALSLENSRSPVIEEFDELWASCRSMSSVKHLLNSQDNDWRFLFTVGTDPEPILGFLMDMPEATVELNIRKPYSLADFTKYINYVSLGSRLKPNKVRTDNCMRYKTENRKCHEPKDFIELTTFLGKDEYYLCAYPTNKCNCTMSALTTRSA